MKLSTIKAIKTFCEGLHSEPCYREVIAEIENGYDDFEVNNVRFIKDSAILSVMTDEIFSDDYILGCFNASFIADNSSLNYALVKACQDAEAYQAIGQALNETMTDSEKESFCEEYARADSYGHHFNHYDGNSEELTVEGILYHVFDNR
jgi:hypothetical protein